MGYTEIVEIASDVIEYLGETYNLTYGDLVKVVDKLEDIVGYIGKYGCPLEDEEEE